MPGFASAEPSGVRPGRAGARPPGRAEGLKGRSRAEDDTIGGVADRTGRSGLAEVFTYQGVAAAYRHRPPYPPEVPDILERLVTDRPRHVLDIGAGDGALARPLAARVERVDAVDVSAAMLAAGRRRPGGRRATLRWIEAAAETCPLDGPYALVTAGASVHWMSWGPLMAHLLPAMSANAPLAIVEHGPRDLPWAAELAATIARHSRSPDFDPRYRVVDALCEQGHFEPRGSAETAAVTVHQPVAAYVEQFHSTASLAREHMSAAEAAEFGRAVERIVAPWSVDGMLALPVVATVTWGRPVAGAGTPGQPAPGWSATAANPLPARHRIARRTGPLGRGGE